MRMSYCLICSGIEGGDQVSKVLQDDNIKMVKEVAIEDNKKIERRDKNGNLSIPKMEDCNLFEEVLKELDEEIEIDRAVEII